VPTRGRGDALTKRGEDRDGVGANDVEEVRLAREGQTRAEHAQRVAEDRQREAERARELADARERATSIDRAAFEAAIGAWAAAAITSWWPRTTSRACATTRRRSWRPRRTWGRPWTRPARRTWATGASSGDG